MKMKKKKILKKVKRMVNVRNIAILLCLVLSAICLFIAFKPEEKTTPSGIKVVSTNVKEDENISEEKAKKVAVKQFKKLDENVKENELNCQKIERQGEEYYYITSKQNSLEIRIQGGKIERINTAPVEE